MRLEIDRATWLHGEGAAHSYLLRASDGKMCCLGFLGRACWIRPRYLEGKKAPDRVGKTRVLRRRWTKGILSEWDTNTNLVEQLMKLNDERRTSYLTEKKRERMLASLFEEIGIEAVFTGRRPWSS